MLRVISCFMKKLLNELSQNSSCKPLHSYVSPAKPYYINAMLNSDKHVLNIKAPNKVAYKHQSGVVLVVSLIMLLLLTLIGLSGMQSATLEEKMAANMRDRNLAFQAAEAALNDAELEIRRHIRIRVGNQNFTPDCGKATNNKNFDGLCDFNAGSVASPVWGKSDVWDSTRSIEYGEITAAKKIGDTDGDGDIDITPALSAQPRYIIEAVQRKPLHICNSGDTRFCYRITARGQGINSHTVVILQATYRPPY